MGVHEHAADVEIGKIQGKAVRKASSSSSEILSEVGDNLDSLLNRYPKRSSEYRVFEELKKTFATRQELVKLEVARDVAKKMAELSEQGITKITPDDEARILKEIVLNTKIRAENLKKQIVNEIVKKAAEIAQKAEKAAEAAREAKKAADAASKAEKVAEKAKDTGKVAEAAGDATSAAKDAKKAADAAKVADSVADATKGAERATEAAKGAERAAHLLEAGEKVADVRKGTQLIKVGNAEVKVVNGLVRASEAARVGAKVTSIATKAGKLMKVVKLAGKVFVVADVALSAYEVYRAYDELKSITEADAEEAKQRYGSDSLLYRARTAADTPEDVVARGNLRVQEETQEALSADEKQILVSARNYGVSATSDLSTYRLHRRGVDNTQRDWLDSIGHFTDSTLATPFSLAYGEGDADKTLDRGEDQLIRTRVQGMEEFIKKIENIDSQTDETRETLKYLRNVIAKCHDVLKRGTPLDQNEKTNINQEKKKATLERMKTLLKQKIESNLSQLTAFTNDLTKPADKRENIKARITQIKAKMGSMDVDQAQKVWEETNALVLQTKSIESINKQIPTIVKHEIQHRINNMQLHGKIPYQGVDYIFSYDAKNGQFSVQAGQHDTPKVFKYRQRPSPKKTTPESTPPSGDTPDS